MYPHLLNAGLVVFFLAVFFVSCGAYSRHCQKKVAYLPLNDQAHALSSVYPIEGLIMCLVLGVFVLSTKFFVSGEATQNQQTVPFLVLGGSCIVLMFWLNSHYAKKYHTVWADPSFNWW